ncbi:hypothetical protein ACP0HM_34475 [Escherichia coli]
MQSRSMNLSSWLRSLALFLGGLALVGLITYFGKWTYLWKEWLTSVDHKRLGIMYIIVAIVMLLRGFADAIMMRSQQALASAGEAGFLPPSPLRSDLYRARRDYDLLRGDAFRYRSDEPGWFRCRLARVTLRSRSSTT